MKRNTLVILCAAALLLAGCSNSTPSVETANNSNSAVSSTTGDTSVTSQVTVVSSSENNVAEIAEPTVESTPQNSTAEIAESTVESTSQDNIAEIAEPTLESAPQDSTAEFVESTLETSSEKENINTPEAGEAYYDNEFKGTTGNTGAPMSYEDVMDMLKVGEDEHGEYIDSFFLVETIRALSLDECAELAGWTEDYADRTVYKVNVLKDLISGEDVNRTEYIFVSMGNVQWQNSGDPIYAPGEKFTVVLAKPQDGCDFLRTPGSFMFRYDVVETSAGDIELYARSNPIQSQNLDSAVDMDTQTITSTTLNPAKYTQKIELTDMVEFIRADWQERMMSTSYNEEV